jgi:hypothetical protein
MTNQWLEGLDKWLEMLGLHPAIFPDLPHLVFLLLFRPKFVDGLLLKPARQLKEFIQRIHMLPGERSMLLDRGTRADEVLGLCPIQEFARLH